MQIGGYNMQIGGYNMQIGGYNMHQVTKHVDSCKEKRTVFANQGSCCTKASETKQ